MPKVDTRCSLSKWMEHRRYPVALLAQELGVTRSAVYAWLAGDAYPSYPHLMKMAAILRCKVEDIILRKEPL